MTTITGKTSILLMLADPVSHVRGSALINRNFDDLGLDAVIVPVHVRPLDLDFTLQAARRMRNLAGLGVTIPHKIAALHLVDRATDAARRIGAVNFIRREADGSLLGHNIDGQSFVAGLMSNGMSVAGKRVLVVGAGGVGRAIAFALADAGAAWLGIANRSAEKARALAAGIAAAVPGCKADPVQLADPNALAGLDLLVNATALGMQAGDPLPIGVRDLSARTTVAEVVINPRMTPLLQAAAARGCAVITGDQMLEPQPALVAGFMNLRQANGTQPEQGKDADVTEALKRNEIVAVVALLEHERLNHGSSGNISVRHGDHVLITPTGARASNLTADGIVMLDLDGNPAAGGAGVPSTEWRLHTELLRHNPSVQAIVHSHADSCVALSCLRLPIPAFHYMVASFGGDTIPCARYEALGSDALAEAVVAASKGHKACLMANHGMVTLGGSLTQAVDLAVKLEMLARQYILSRQAGEPVLLTPAEMAEVHRRYPYYGHARMPRQTA